MTGELDLFGKTRAEPKAVRRGRRVHLAGPVRVRAEEMRAQGASCATIARALGISESTVRTRLRPELERACPGGRRPGRPRWKPTAEDRATIARLAAEGLTVEAIGEALAVTAPTIRRHCAADLAIGRAERVRRLAERPPDG